MRVSIQTRGGIEPHVFEGVTNLTYVTASYIRIEMGEEVQELNASTFVWIKVEEEKKCIKWEKSYRDL